VLGRLPHSDLRNRSDGPTILELPILGNRELEAFPEVLPALPLLEVLGDLAQLRSKTFCSRDVAIATSLTLPSRCTFRLATFRRRDQAHIGVVAQGALIVDHQLSEPAVFRREGRVDLRAQ
jgi:hypothetical protein